MTEPTFAAEVLAAFDLGPDERQILAEAERTIAELNRISAALADAPLMINGSTGQQRANPLFAEARAHRELLAKLLARLALPSEEDERPQTLTQRLDSDKARAAARDRWSRRGTA